MKTVATSSNKYTIRCTVSLRGPIKSPFAKSSSHPPIWIWPPPARVNARDAPVGVDQKNYHHDGGEDQQQQDQAQDICYRHSVSISSLVHPEIRRWASEPFSRRMLRQRGSAASYSEPRPTGREQLAYREQPDFLGRQYKLSLAATQRGLNKTSEFHRPGYPPRISATVIASPYPP